MQGLRRVFFRLVIGALIAAAIPFIIGMPRFLAAPAPNIDYKAAYRRHAEAYLSSEVATHSGNARDALAEVVRIYEESERRYRESTATDEFPAGTFFNWYVESECEVNKGPKGGTPDDLKAQLAALIEARFFEAMAALRRLPRWQPEYEPQQLMRGEDSLDSELMNLRSVAPVVLCNAAILLDHGDIEGARGSLEEVWRCAITRSSSQTWLRSCLVTALRDKSSTL